MVVAQRRGAMATGQVAMAVATCERWPQCQEDKRESKAVGSYDRITKLLQCRRLMTEDTNKEGTDFRFNQKGSGDDEIIIKWEI